MDADPTTIVMTATIKPEEPTKHEEIYQWGLMAGNLSTPPHAPLVILVGLL